MRQKLISIFVISSGVLLILTAVAKLISSFGTARILYSVDPIFLISFGRIFQVTAVVELGVATICFLNKNRILQTGLIALLASNFLLYRFGLHWVGYRGLCPCLGNLTDALLIPPQTVDTIMKIILAYLLIGSYATLFWLWMQRTRATPSASA
jgi:hypothetical protein